MSDKVDELVKFLSNPGEFNGVIDDHFRQESHESLATALSGSVNGDAEELAATLKTALNSEGLQEAIKEGRVPADHSLLCYSRIGLLAARAKTETQIQKWLSTGEVTADSEIDKLIEDSSSFWKRYVYPNVDHSRLQRELVARLIDAPASRKHALTVVAVRPNDQKVRLVTCNFHVSRALLFPRESKTAFMFDPTPIGITDATDFWRKSAIRAWELVSGSHGGTLATGLDGEGDPTAVNVEVVLSLQGLHGMNISGASGTAAIALFLDYLFDKNSKHEEIDSDIVISADAGVFGTPAKLTVQPLKADRKTLALKVRKCQEETRRLILHIDDVNKLKDDLREGWSKFRTGSQFLMVRGEDDLAPVDVEAINKKWTGLTSREEKLAAGAEDWQALRRYASAETQQIFQMATAHLSRFMSEFAGEVVSESHESELLQDYHARDFQNAIDAGEI